MAYLVHVFGIPNLKVLEDNQHKLSAMLILMYFFLFLPTYVCVNVCLHKQRKRGV